MLSWIFIVLAHWDNSSRIDMSPHSDILSWFWANQSLLLLLNAACLTEKQQIPILSYIHYSSSNCQQRETNGSNFVVYSSIYGLWLPLWYHQNFLYSHETIFSQDHMGLRLYDGWIYNYVKGTDCIVSDLLFNTKRAIF